MLKKIIFILLSAGALALPLWASAVSVPGRELVQYLNRAGVSEYERYDYRGAARFFERAVKIHRAVGGSRDPAFGQVLHNLATAFFYLGEKQKAIPLFEQAILIRERFLGPGHPDLAQSLSNLAILYLFDRDFEKAEPLFLRALEIRRSALGPEHIETARTMHDLAELYRKQEKYEASLALHDKALGIRLRLEPGSKFTGASYYHRGEIFRALARPGEAASAYRRAYEILLRALGPDHLLTRVVSARLAEMTGGPEGSPRQCPYEAVSSRPL